MSCIFERIPKEKLFVIEPLWQKLNAIHAAESPYFRQHYAAFTFEQRIQKFLALDDEYIRIDTVYNAETLCGYCISTALEKNGELESLFVAETERGKGLGEKLVQAGTGWMRERGCTVIRVSVSWGHESVFGFYERMGFFPRLTCLELKAPG
ncbi:MAG: GNAT family N-acetyltransferase [Spirochaetales bacterium]|nr:GNAT family N-acetyltransferase [Spirochaetales bacterium]